MSTKRVSVVVNWFFVIMILSCNSDKKTPEQFINKGVEGKISSFLKKGNIPSLQLAIVSENNIVYSNVFGNNTNENSLYMNGSIQKVFDATAILQLVEKGKIELNTDVNEILPFELRHPDYPKIPITISMLLSHMSGLSCPDNQFEWDTDNVFAPKYKKPLSDEIVNMSLEEYLKNSLTIDGLNFQESVWKYKPGTRYYYSLIAYPLLKFIIERVSGMEYPQYMKKHIFEPLGMVNSGFYQAEFSDKNIVPYTRTGKENSELPIWDGNGFLMRTNATDMGKFMIAHINNGLYNDYKLLSSKHIDVMRKNHTKGKSIESGYGFGLVRYSNNLFGHGGSTVGYQGLWSFNPSKKLGYIILVNVNGILGGEFNAVWEVVSNVENEIKSELGLNSKESLYKVSLFLLILLILGGIYIKAKRRKLAA